MKVTFSILVKAELYGDWVYEYKQGIVDYTRAAIDFSARLDFDTI